MTKLQNSIERGTRARYSLSRASWVGATSSPLGRWQLQQLSPITLRIRRSHQTDPLPQNWRSLPKILADNAEFFKNLSMFNQSSSWTPLSFSALATGPVVANVDISSSRAR